MHIEHDRGSLRVYPVAVDEADLQVADRYTVNIGPGLSGVLGQAVDELYRAFRALIAGHTHAHAAIAAHAGLTHPGDTVFEADRDRLALLGP